jgi:hypothetical protein
VGIGSVYAAHEDSLECLLASRHQQPLKTLYTGLGGLYLRPISGGTLIWTLPDGQTYVTTPGCARPRPASGSGWHSTGARRTRQATRWPGHTTTRRQRGDVPRRRRSAWLAENGL